MGVGSSRARVADLLFQVFDRAVHPDWFVPRQHRRCVRDTWQADIRIVDGGHVITWASGSVRLTESLVEASAARPEQGRLFCSPIHRERSTVLRPAEGIEYQSCFESERLDRAVFAHVCEELILDGGKSGLFHRFTPHDRITPPPVSRIHVESRSRGLSIHTFHTFPDECAIVRTQSLFETHVPVPR